MKIRSKMRHYVKLQKPIDLVNSSDVSYYYDHTNKFIWSSFVGATGAKRLFRPPLELCVELMRLNSIKYCRYDAQPEVIYTF